MAGITGIGTTFTLPNYHGELFAVSPSDTPLLSAIGGLTGGQQTDSTTFEWQTYDLRNPAQPAVLEGANAPAAQERTRDSVENVVQIHHEKVEVSYTKQAAVGQYATPTSAPFQSRAGASNPVSDELDWQTMQALVQIASDVNFSFYHGKFNKPTSNSAARKTRGLLQAIATNVVNKGTVLSGASTATDTITVTHALNVGDRVVFTDTGAATNVVAGRTYYVQSKSTTVSFKVAATPGGAALTLGTATVDLIAVQATALATTDLDGLLQMAYDNGGLTGGVATLAVNSAQKRAVTAAYAAAYGKAQPVRGNIAGVNVTQLETDFGVLNVMLDRHVPQDAIVVLSLDQLAPVFLNVPNKGVFFEEALAKTGATDAVQIYGEIGLKYGNEKAHAVLRGLAIA
jgi:hypothetical protein